MRNIYFFSMGAIAMVLGLTAWAGDQKESTERQCEFGHPRGQLCQIGGGDAFCDNIRVSEIFPDLLECQRLHRSCKDQGCPPFYTTHEGKRILPAYESIHLISDELVVAQNQSKNHKYYAALYDRMGENLIPANTHVWGCDQILLEKDEHVRCVRHAAGSEAENSEVWSLEDLRAFRGSSFPLDIVLGHSDVDLCQVARRAPQHPLQFWSNRFRIGQEKHKVHLEESATEGSLCRLSQSEELCRRLWVRADGVFCERDGQTTVLRSGALSVEERTENLLEWLNLSVDPQWTAAEFERRNDEGFIRLKSKQALWADLLSKE